MKSSLTAAKEAELKALRSGEENLYSIKCTSCAAPLQIRAGANVSTLTCEYCHSVLDLNDEYKVLAKFNNVKRPDSRFKMGMTGKIKGVEWTIIGWISYKTAEFPPETWHEFFLYSPLYGYAWLVEEGKQLSFSKRVRDFDLNGWMQDKEKTLFYKKGHYLLAEEPYDVYIEYVEGEMSWVAKFGDIIRCWDYNGVSGKSLSIEKNSNEVEICLNEKLNPKYIYQSFGIESYGSKIADKSASLNSNTDEDDDYDDGVVIEDDSFFGNVTKFYVMLLLLLIGFGLYGMTQEKSLLTLSNINQNNHQSFEVKNSAFLTKISMDSPQGIPSSSLLRLSKEGKELVMLDQNTVKLKDKNIYIDWTSSILHTDIYIKLDKGTYTLEFIDKVNQSKPVSIEVKTGVVWWKFILWLMALMGIALVLMMGSFSKYLLWIVLGGIVIYGLSMVEFDLLVFIPFVVIYMYFTGDMEFDEYD